METTRLINARRVPSPLAEPLSSAVNELVSRGTRCAPAVPSSPAPTTVSHGKGRGDGKRAKHGRGHRKGDG